MPNIVPDEITLPLFGGITIHETLFSALCVSIGIMVFAVIFRLFLFPRFKEKPAGFQNFIELIVGGIDKFANSIMGKRGAQIAGYMFTIAFYMIICGLTELFGVRAPQTDLNYTFSLAIMSFVLMIVFGIRSHGVGGWLKSYTKPMAVVTPFRVISDCVLPVSLACRMFGNLFSGLVVMNMIYSGMGMFAIAVPAFASLYFTLFHVGMQTYVFLMLTLSFVNEKAE